MRLWTYRLHLTLARPFKLPSQPRSIKSLSFSLKFNLGFHHSQSMASPPPQPIEVKDKIDLTEKETQIFDLLLSVVRHFTPTHSSFKDTQLRVAGGWVRDKLLGKECHDIDIALNNMLGREFGEKVQEYLSVIGEVKQEVHVIKSNPEQSKHLETANMRIYGLSIDFVNLRSEDYSENSRIPTMKFGTAKEDAYRRDLTINSLFYNISTSSVEDFTERGLADLKFGKIVTPLHPKDTFLDDPLRVLRAIRFGARFGFVLDEKLREAAASNEVKVAIADKISRERIGEEINLMISGNGPVKAVDYVCDLQLFWVVFNLPPRMEPLKFEGCDRHCSAYLDAAWSLLRLVGFHTFSDEERRLYLYGSLFLPLRKSVYAEKKDKKVPIVNHIFRNSLKRKIKDAEMVVKLHDAAGKFLTLIPSITSNELEHVNGDYDRRCFDVPDSSRQRIMIGKLLLEIKEFWRISLLISTLISSSDSSRNDAFTKPHDELDKSRQLYVRVEKAIMELGLENVWDKKQVDGKEIMRILQVKTGGPQVGIWKDRLTEWQLGHPSATTEECLDWMRQHLEDQPNSKRAKLEDSRCK